VDGLFDLDLELGGEGIDVDFNCGLEFVVVAVAGGVVALTEEGGVFLVGHRGGVESVGGGELVVLLEENLVGCGIGHCY